MSANATLNSAQSKIVRDLEKSVDGFYSENMFISSKVLRTAHLAVVVNLRELEAEFPVFAKEATAYYYDSEGDVEYPEELEGYGDALYSLLLTLYSFLGADSVGQIAELRSNLYDGINDFRSFSPEYNWERGFWNDEVTSA